MAIQTLAAATDVLVLVHLYCYICQAEKPNYEFSSNQREKYHRSNGRQQLRCIACVQLPEDTLKCAACDEVKSKAQFSKSQRRQKDSARCMKCVELGLESYWSEESEGSDPGNAPPPPSKKGKIFSFSDDEDDE
ncbi:hypothetical protein HK102_000586 [Quaeritorhiza haematococci]|nr:hypothetical protein HK102_000586 [Quaeritorhiza haematococci]